MSEMKIEKLPQAELAKKRALRLMDPLENNLSDAIIVEQDLAQATWLIEQDGVDPDCSALHPDLNPLRRMIVHNIPHKLGFARLLVENGASILKAKESIGYANLFTLGSGGYGDRYQEGDEKCAAYLLAHFIAMDIEDSGKFDLEFWMKRSIPYQDSYDTKTKIVDNSYRINTVKCIIRNQNALVDYIASSEDDVARYLRELENHPSAAAWMQKADICDVLKSHPPAPITLSYKVPYKEYRILPADFSYAVTVDPDGTNHKNHKPEKTNRDNTRTLEI